MWLDLNAADDVVPSFNGKVLLKVSRVAHAHADGAAVAAGPTQTAARAATAVAVETSGRGTPTAPTTGGSSVSRGEPRASPAAAAAAPPAAAPVQQRRPVPAAAAAASAAPAQVPDMLGLFDSGISSGGGASPVPADIFSSQPAPAAKGTAGATAGGLDAFAFGGTAAPAGKPLGPQALGGGPARGSVTAQPKAASTTGGILSTNDIFNF